LAASTGMMAIRHSPAVTDAPAVLENDQGGLL
jgi:hypothetical protein